MPVVKTKSGKWKAYEGSPAEFKTKTEAEAQLNAIRAEQSRRSKKGK